MKKERMQRPLLRRLMPLALALMNGRGVVAWDRKRGLNDYGACRWQRQELAAAFGTPSGSSREIQSIDYSFRRKRQQHDPSRRMMEANFALLQPAATTSSTTTSRSSSPASTAAGSSSLDDRRRRVTSTNDTKNDDQSNRLPLLLLDDGRGHINAELADRIWHWEQEQRQLQELPPVEYSVRAGLRLVDVVVLDLMTSSRNNNNNNNLRPQTLPTLTQGKQADLYSDLVQEGLIALLDAMRQYRLENRASQSSVEHAVVESSHKQQRVQHQHHRNASSRHFEEYARNQIQHRLLEYLAQNNVNTNYHRQPAAVQKPMARLPQAVVHVFHEARKLILQQMEDHRQQAEQLDIAIQASKGDKTGTVVVQDFKPNYAAVAEQLQIPVSLLQDYLRAAARAYRATTEAAASTKSTATPTKANMFTSPLLSVESTVEIFHPVLEDVPAYTDPHGGRVLHDSYYYDYDETQQEAASEGDDQSWIIQQMQIAGPLQDVIPDTDQPSPDDVVLANLIRSDVSKFLSSTLDPLELQVVRYAFGLASSGNDDDMNEREKQQQQFEPMQMTVMESSLGSTTVSQTAASSSISSLSLDMTVAATTTTGRKEAASAAGAAATGRPYARNEIAAALHITPPDRVSKILTQALQKLRQSYHSRFIESYYYDEDEHSDHDKEKEPKSKISNRLGNSSNTGEEYVQWRHKNDDDDAWFHPAEDSL